MIHGENDHEQVKTSEYQLHWEKIADFLLVYFWATSKLFCLSVL